MVAKLATRRLQKPPSSCLDVIRSATALLFSFQEEKFFFPRAPVAGDSALDHVQWRKSPNRRKHVHGIQEQLLFQRTMRNVFFHRKSSRTMCDFELIMLFHLTKRDRRPDAPATHHTPIERCLGRALLPWARANQLFVSIKQSNYTGVYVRRRKSSCLLS